MSADIILCNRALSAIGTRSSIASLTEKSPEAQQCALIYGHTRDSLLQSAHWDFARATAYLTLLKALPGTPENPNPPPSQAWNPVTMPAPPWAYSYAYPSDCIQVRCISPQIFAGGALPGGLPIFSAPTFVAPPAISLVAQPFMVATDKDQTGFDITVILTNQTQAISCYTRQVTAPGLWSHLFQDAMVDSLATQLAMALTGNLTLARAKAQSALGTLMIARARDGNEGLTINNSIPEWIRVRGYAGDWTLGDGSWWTSWITPSFLLI